jgi:hypothetical protein
VALLVDAILTLMGVRGDLSPAKRAAVQEAKQSATEIAEKATTKEVRDALRKEIDAFPGIRSKGDIAAANRLRGKAAEAAVAKELLAEGYRILGSQVAIRTSRGIRFVDHLVLTPGGKIVAVEVKSGGACRSATQLAKDKLIATEGGIVLGKHAPPDLKGRRVVIETIERRPKE